MDIKDKRIKRTRTLGTLLPGQIFKFKDTNWFLDHYYLVLKCEYFFDLTTNSIFGLSGHGGEEVTLYTAEIHLMDSD